MDIYNACDDNYMHIQDKYKKISDTRYLDKDIDQLVFCLGEEMGVCSENIRQDLKPKYTEISQGGKELKFLISQYSDESSFRFQTAKAVFEGMLQLVNNAVDLLKMADQHFVERLVNETNVALIYLKKVRESTSKEELLTNAREYTTAFANLIKRLAKRIESGVLYPEQLQKAEDAMAILRSETPIVIDVKKHQLTFPGNEMHTNALAQHVKNIVAAAKIVFDVARSDPKFSVDFQVDFVDDKFGLLLSELAAAVDSCDQQKAVYLMEQISHQVGNRIAETILPQGDPKLQKAQQSLHYARDCSFQCLNSRLDHKENTIIIEAGKRMELSLKQLREAYNGLVPNPIPTDRTNLRKAAQAIVANLDKLIQAHK